MYMSKILLLTLKNRMDIKYTRNNGPVASKHGNRRSLLYAGSMAYLGRTTGRHRHGMGEGEGNSSTDRCT